MNNEHFTLGKNIDNLLDQLYTLSNVQVNVMEDYFTQRASEGTLDWNNFDDRTNEFLRDKLIAIDRSKAEFCYHMCRALKAKRVVEAGTSYGVSTMFLAAAVRDNVRGDNYENKTNETPIVIGTEFESEKVKIANQHFVEAGLSDLIDLRQGDLKETLTDVNGPIDFMLIDVWTWLARPALELIAPHLREGAVVICDNTLQFRDAYTEYFEFIHDPRNSFRTMTLPFENGLEFSVHAR